MGILSRRTNNRLTFLQHSNRVPIADTFGRRPVLIFSCVVCLASNIWRAKATSYGSFMGACVLNGFGAGPCEVSEMSRSG